LQKQALDINRNTRNYGLVVSFKHRLHQDIQLGRDALGCKKVHLAQSETLVRYAVLIAEKTYIRVAVRTETGLLGL